MLSTGRLLAVFFVAAFKKNSRKRRAIIFNNAITIRGRCLSCKIPTAGKALGHSGKWDANIQDYLFLKIPESNNNTTHCSEQCIKWLVCYCLQEALGSAAKGPAQAKHSPGDGRGESHEGLFQAPCPCSNMQHSLCCTNSIQQFGSHSWSLHTGKSSEKNRNHILFFSVIQRLLLWLVAVRKWRHILVTLCDEIHLQSPNSFSKLAMRSIIHGVKVLKKL